MTPSFQAGKAPGALPSAKSAATARAVIARPVWSRHVDPESFKDGKWTYKTTYRKVEVMSAVGGYAMVRRKGRYPFVVRLKDIMPQGFTPPEKDTTA